MALNDPKLDQLVIETGSVRLDGWISTRVCRSMESVPSFFDISLTERAPNSATQAIVVPGSTCRIFLGNDLILTGFIDSYMPSFDGHTHFVRITGRSNVEDIVDSSFVMQAKVDWVISGSLKQAIEKILKPFPTVGLRFNGPDVKIPVPYSVNPGETVWSVIETLCHMCAKLVWDDKDGFLVVGDVTKTDRAGSALVEGVNVEAAAVHVNWTQRVHHLQVINSTAVQTRNGSLNIASLADAFDDELKSRSRTRLFLMDADVGISDQLAQARATWMMNRLKGRSLLVQVHVTGWRDGKGKLWTPNTLIKAKLPTLKITGDHDLVVAQCEWTRDETGTKTIMTLMPVGALTPQPYIFKYTAGQGAA